MEMGAIVEHPKDDLLEDIHFLKNMEKKVRKISLASDPGATYFLQIGWEEELDQGFTVTLCNGHTAWIGEVSGKDVSREAMDMEMERPKYVEELKKALITVAQPANKYSFDLVKDGEDPEMYCFTYEKKLKDVSFKLGSLRLKNAPNPGEIIKELINYCLNCTTELHSRNEHLLKENERLRRDWNYIHDKLEKFVNSKEELEQDLYTRFTCVLNEKKAKIRSLNEKLSQVQQKVQEKSFQHSNSSIPFDTVPVGDLVNDYSGSTDDDSKISEVKKETASEPPSRRRSLVNSPDDSPDIAPSRKRRQRGQKITYTEVKDKLPQTEEQEEQRFYMRAGVIKEVNGKKMKCKPAPSKTTGKNPSSGKTPLSTSENTPDPDDLFSDI